MIELSVIIPVYNCEKYIKKCVQSILSCNEKVEIILVNDGSTDASGVICERIAEKHKNVIVLSQENAGCASARNLGTSYAQGEFIWYIDADDYVAENAVSEILQVLRREDSIDLVRFNIATVYQDRTIFKNQIKKREYLNRTEALENALYLDKMTFSACDKVFRRSFLGKDPFPSGIPMGEEQIAGSRLISRAKKVLLLPKCYYFYVQRASSESHFQGKKNSEKMKLLYDSYCSVAQELETSAPELRSAIYARLIFQGICIIGWMARSKTCNKDLGKRITQNIRGFLLGYWRNGRVSLIYKMTAALASVHYKLVYYAYRIMLLFRSTSNLTD